MRILSILILTTLIFNLFGQNQAAYVRSTTGQPWGNSNNELFMDEVYGAGNWDDLRFESVSMSTLLTGRSILFLDGSDNGANELESFLIANLSALESWVSSGGNLFLNSAPNEGNGMSFGFAGTELHYTLSPDQVSASDLMHPIFSGPFLPVGSAWSGNSFAHAVITGTGLTTLITEANDPGQVVLAEKPYGGGRVIFGAMTTTNFHSPQPQAFNLRRNILEYLKFNPVPVDAGISAIDSPYAFCPGSHNVIARLTNFGRDTLQNVNINWEFDGVAQTALMYSTPLDTIGSGNNSVNVLLGSRTFLAGELYPIKVWTSNPNSMMDTVNFNDTASVVVSPGLSGSYTIGGASPDFATFSEAIDLLNAYGVCGPVVFNVRNGNYFDQISLHEINGTSATNSITFQSESMDSSDVILSHSASTFDSNYTVQLINASWVTFRHMTLEATGTSYSHIIEIMEGATNNTFSHLAIRGPLVESTSSSFALVYADVGINENTRFHSNSFENGSGGIYFFGEFNGGNYVPGLEIHHNAFTDQYYYGILCGDLNSPLINGNTITTTESYQYFTGIELYSVYNGFEVAQNHIESPFGYSGLTMYDTYGSDTTECLIRNNFIFVGGDQFNDSYGIYAYCGTYLTFLHNTVHVTSSSTESQAIYLYVEPGELSGCEQTGAAALLFNNIIANTGSGYAVFMDHEASIDSSDFNDFYAPSIVNFAFVPSAGNLSNLSEWQTETGMDLNSFGLDPGFLVVPGFEITEAELNDAGIPTSPLTTTDIEFDTRSATTPDIGSDEWTPPALDAALIDFVHFPPPEGMSNVVVILKNYGLSTLTSADLDWELDSVPQAQVNWTGSLATGDTAQVVLGMGTFGFVNTHDLRAWVSNPNMQTDSRPQNDTIQENGFFPGLEGIYTIGGVDPDFPTFTDAVNALSIGGVAGAVTFLVRDGIYSEQLNFEPIIGTSAASPVTFTSESGDSSLVILEFNSTFFAENYTIRFNGADFLTFSQMTLRSVNATYGTVIHLTNQSDHITLDRNRIEGIETTSTGSEYTLVYSPADVLNTHFTLSDNVLLNGSYGLYFTANFQHTVGTMVTGNAFHDQYTYAIYLDEHSSPEVNGNFVTTNSTYCCFRGIWINDCEQGGELSRNHVDLPLYGIGIYIDDWFATSGNPVWITSNYVHIGPGTFNTAQGIYFGDGSEMHLLNNTVHVRNTGTGSNAVPLYHTQGTTKTVQNNIFVNSGGGYAVYYGSIFGITLSDNNNYYTTGGNLGFYNTNMISLEDWQNNSGLDANSFQVDPLFIADTSYQIREVFLNNAAAPSAAVSIDIENEARNLTTPDIGADEWTPPTLDAALPGFANFPFPEGNNYIRVILKNNGSDTLTNANLDWTLNGIPQTTVQWTGSLASGDTVHAILDTTTFVLSQSKDIRSWVSNPNGGTDAYPFNDTTEVIDAFPGLAGIYTVGGLSPDYVSFGTAVNALATHGVAGSVTFLVRSGTYSEQLSIAAIAGADASRPTVFRSESGDSTQVILTFGANSSNNYTVRLNGADWITFADMTIQATNTTYSHVIEVTNGSRHIGLENNVLVANTTTSTSSNQAIVYVSSSIGNDFLNVRNNRIAGGSFGIYFVASSSHATGTRVIGNQFVNQYYYAVYLDEHNKPVVNQNIVTTNTNYCCFYGLTMYDCNLGSEMIGNSVSIPLYGYGIYLEGLYGSVTDSSWITNNFVYIGPGNTNTAHGIYYGYAEYSNLLFNTVRVRNIQASSSSTALITSSGVGKVIMNNLAVNSGGGFAMIYNSLSGIVTSDYNNYHTTGEYLAYANGNVETLGALKLASGKEANSVSVDPMFVNNTGYLLTEIDLDGAGTPAGNVSVDIQGDVRNVTNPDIGADEWIPALVDAALTGLASPVFPFTTGTHDVAVVLKNNGTDTLTSVNIDWKANMVSQNQTQWTGTLLSGDTAHVTLTPPQAFNLNNPVSIQAWVSDPNGLGNDVVPANDTLETGNIYPALAGTYTIGGTTPDFPTFSAAVFALNQGGVADSVQFLVRNGTFTEQISINEIKGNDATKPILFTSEAGDSSLVILTFSATSGNNYTVRCNGVDYITFSNLTLRGTNASFCQVMHITNESNHVSIDASVLTGPVSTSTSTNTAIIFSTGTYLNQHFSLTNSMVTGGAYGIYYASTGANAAGTTILGNGFTNQYYRGLALYEHSSLIVNDNILTTNSAYCCYTGIEMGGCENGGEALRNQIRTTANGTGIYVSGWYGTSLDRVWVTNNYVSIGGGTSTHYGIFISDGSYVEVAFNTVDIRSTSISSCALYNNFGSNIFIRNNLLANFGGGYSIYFANLPSISNFNNLFTTGSVLGFYSTNRTDLSAFRTATGREANSLSVDPFFVSHTNYPITQSLLHGAATPVAGVTIDIEGDPRDPLNPDIGADEFDLTGLDAGIFTLVTPAIPFPAGNEQVSAVLINHGSDTLTTVNINWTINGLIQPVINWNGSLLSGDTMLVSLNSVNFEAGVGFDIQSWTSNPNGMTDVVAINDTAEVNDIYGALSGVYTIGGASPDFLNFATPVNALNFGGILGPVTFNVRNGTYAEQISINPINGANALNPVIFQSESGVNTNVVLTFNALVNNYTVRLNGADYVTFLNMTLAATNTTNSRVIDITNMSNHIVLNGNIITGVTTTNTSDLRALLYSNTSFLNEYLTVTQNEFRNGSYGLWYNTTTTNANGTVITGNTFLNQYTFAIYLDEHNDPVVNQNTITTNTTYTDFRGVFINDSNLGGKVLRNQIHLATNGTGIFVEDWVGSTTDSILIANNFVSVGTGTTVSSGIHSLNGSYHYIYHNNVSMRNTNTSSRAFYQSGGSNKQLNNNIFANSGGGYAIYYSTTTGVIESDYNDLYKTGTNLGFRTINHTTLAAWQSNTGDDGNSISENPQYIDNTNLHVQNVLLNSSAIPLAAITVDIDGETRDALNPDIGADEFSTDPEDASILAITSPVMPFPADLQNITVNLRNNGIDTLEFVTIGWELNGIPQPAFNWTGNLLAGQTDISLAIGSFTFEIDTMYTIRAWTSEPNGVVDPQQDNDTTTVTNLYAALSGIYTIGGTTPDFDDFTRAVTTLNHGGVIGPVIFDVRNGSYNERIVLNEILGANGTNTITFRSESQDSSLAELFTTSANSSQNYTVQLNGTDWIRFEHLTLRNNSTTYGRVIDIFNGATQNIFSHNRITGNNVSSTNTEQALVHSANSLDDNTTFSNNRFSEGSYGMYWFANSSLEEGTIVEGNQFIGQYYMAVRFDDQDAPYLGFNTFTSNVVNSSFYTVYSNDCYNGIEYVNNHFFDIPRGFGFYLNNADGTALARGLIANNFIHIGANTNNANYGIYSTSSDYLDIYHNTINLVSTSSSSRALFVSSNFTNVRNNVLACSNQGAAIEFSSGSSFVSNFNDLFTVNGTSVGIWLGSNTATLANWQSASGLDANSKSIDPIFVSPSDLHVEELDLNNTGTPLALVPLDFDGDARNPLTPDIGADEFDPITTNDAQVTMILSPSKEIPFSAGVQPVTVEIKNNGADTLINLTIAWTANGLPQVSHGWTGYMLPGDRENVVIGSHNFTVGFGNDIVVYSQNPNGQPDNRPVNDTASVEDLYPALSGVYTIGGSFPNFSSFNLAATALNQGGVLGPVTFNVRNGTYPEQFVITEFNGASATNTVTFQSQNGDGTFVKLERTNGSGNNYLVLLDGADYVTFNEITFRPTSTVYTRAVELRNGAHRNTITNCHFIDVNNGNDEFIYSSSSYINNYTIIQNNVFEGGGYAVYLSGQNTGSLETGNQVLDNVIENPEFTGIYLQYQDGPQVLRNQITTNSTNTNYSGINCRYCDNALSIVKNKITGGLGWGLNLYRCDGAPVQRGQVINNFVQVGGTVVGYGIYTYEGSNQDIFFNSVNVSGTNAASTAFYNYNGSSKTLLNNIFANTGGAWASYVTGGGAINTANFNDLHSSGANLGWWDNNVATNLVSWQAITGRDNSSVSANPLFYSPTNLHVLQVALDSAGSTLTGILDDIDGEVRANGFPDIGADEFDYLENDLGIIALISPADACDLTNAETVTVAIQNYGALPQTGFDVSYDLPGSPAVVENVGSLVVNPGDTAHYTFTTPVNVSFYLIYPFELNTSLAGDLNPGNDALEESVQNFQLPDEVGNMLPANNAVNLDPPINFSWLPSIGALRYDLFVWKQGDPIPSTPTGQDLTQITYAYNSSALIYGETYSWKVIAKNNHCSTEGPTQTFTLRELPDLRVEDVDVPVSAFSGQNIEVTWEVMNDAIAQTGMASWYDYIYLSANNVFNTETDIYLGGFANFSALNGGMSYTNMKSVTLPQGIEDTWYVFVVTDRNNSLIEINNNNNVSVGAAIPITLTPPPDMIVTSIITPNQAFSGTNINVTWTVLNQGNGNDANGGTHSDRIYISDFVEFSPIDAILLKTVGSLTAPTAGNSYMQSTSVMIPPSVFGEYYIHVVTDHFNQVYEYVFEDNNDGTSDTMDIILTPPPDLVVTNLVTPTVVSNREVVNVQWTVFNQGGSIATDNFTDRIYLSTKATFHIDSVTQLGSYPNSTDITPFTGLARSTNVTIPSTVSGTQFIYVFTDVTNVVFEYTNENNNITRSDSITANNADLIVTQVTIPETIASSAELIVEWSVQNQGLGTVGNFNRTDEIFISSNAVLNTVTATSLGILTYSGALSAGQSTIKQKSVTVPNGISGEYFIHVRTDVSNTIFENTNENNNTNVDSTLVLLAPWPDIRIDTLIGLPDTTVAGTLLSLEYIVRNYGDTAVQGSGAWKDRIYVSPNPTWNPANAFAIKTLDQLHFVEPDSSYTGSTQFNLPMMPGGATTGVCFIYVFADVTNKIFEHTDEGNNVRRSNPIVVFAPEPVDLAMINATALPDTVTSGDPYNIQYMVQNVGSATSVWGYPLWYEGVYLSVDSNYNMYSDIFVKDFTKQGPVDHLEMYSNSQMFNLPNGLSGNYYAFIVADHAKLTNDENFPNNRRRIRPASHPTGPAMPIHILLKPSPDLAVSTMSAPTMSDAGQPVQIIWTVENNGDGTTSGSWTDKVYLSTDFNISASDKIIASITQSRTISPSGSYTDTVNAVIPISSIGNFVLILKTDANNSVYEHNGENNNSFFSFITTSLPLPSDLVVENIQFNNMAMVGENFTVTYDLKNQGVNPASGQLWDAIYLSSDSMFDATDVKFFPNPIQRNISLGPQTSNAFPATNLTPGVPLGDYFVIVQTDVLNNIYENSDTNNITVSDYTVQVSIQELPLGVQKTDTMVNNRGIYYRVEIPDTLENETLLVTLDALSTTGVNELYLSHGDVPTRSVHDFKFGKPFVPDQEIIVPELQPGTYYLLGYGELPGAPQSQTVHFKAEIIPFQIRNVEAARGGNTGNVTLKIEGAKFTSNMTLRLQAAGLDSIVAHKIIFINSTKVFATFNLAGAELGMYDMAGIKINESTLLDDAFEIVQGGPGSIVGGPNGGFFCDIVNVGTDDNLSKNIQHPAQTRVNRIVPITIQFGNGGNTDIPCPYRWLLSLRGAPITFNPDDFTENLQELYIEFQEPGGPPGLLRPGATASITVYAFSSQPLSFLLTE